MTIQRFISRLAIAGAAMTLSAGTAIADELRPFEAHYNVIWKGIGAGRSSLTLKRLDNERWSYETRNVARGLFRVALPGDISQSSEFRVVNGTVMPEHFRGDDGTDATRKDVDIRFDWQAHRATGVAEDKRIEVALEPGIQDGMSVQAALMIELMHGRTPSSFMMLDKDRVKEYLYSREGTETLETAIGRKETVIFRSRRPDSEHSTMYWCVPEMGYVPVKVERRNGKKTEWSMLVQSATRE